LTDQLPESWREAEAIEESLREGDGAFLGPVVEADGTPDGSKWEVIVIRAGLSKNGRRYSEAVLQGAIGLFEGARVLARSDQEHVSGDNKSVLNAVGWIEGVRFERRALRATLHLVDEGLRSKLLEAWNRGKHDFVGLSIVAEGEGRTVTEAGVQVQSVESITRVSSVDLVFDPAAGGGLVRLVAAEGKEEEPMLQKLIEKLREANADIPKLLQGVAESLGYSVEEVVALVVAEAPELTESLQEATREPAAPPAADPAAGGAPAAPAPVAEAVDPDLVPAALSRFVVRTELAETKLPEPVQKRIERRFAGQAFKAEDLTEAIRDEVSTWAEIERANGLGSSTGEQRSVGVGTEAKDKALVALTGFFAEADLELDGHKVQRYRSFREAYIDLTGDQAVTGDLPTRESGKLGISRRNNGLVDVPLFESVNEGGTIKMKLAEAGELLSTSWTEILGDSITRVMLREYAASELSDWRDVVDVVPVNDFRTQRRMRFGGYGDLPAVAQAAAYVDLTTPGDEEATYAATKRGGIEKITLEAIANDDVGAIRRIPARLARAAARTLYKFVFDFMRTNAAIYDAVAWFHATHGANLLATALSQASITSARVVLFEQTDMSTNEQLGLDIKHLFVPIELEQLAYELTQSVLRPGTADNDANYTRQLSIVPHTVKYWTDSTDWVATCDKADCPIIEVGFFNGEEPELFTQDMPNVGSMFDSDILTYKIRHIYGGAVMDFRGAVKSVQ